MGISGGLCAFRALGKCQPVCLLPCKCCSLGRRNPTVPSECFSPAAFQLTLPERLKKGLPLCAGTVDCTEIQPSKLESMEGPVQSPQGPLPSSRQGGTSESNEAEKLSELWRGRKLSAGMGAAVIDSDVLSEGRLATSSAASAWGGRACKPAEEGAVLCQQLEPPRVSLQSCHCSCSWRSSVTDKLAS